MPKVCEVAGGLRFLAENSLEEYRAESMLTKEPETIAWIDAEFRRIGVGCFDSDRGQMDGVVKRHARGVAFADEV